jgi:ribosomal protein S18 acetylase RimI-like enzyme
MGEQKQMKNILFFTLLFMLVAPNIANTLHGEASPQSVITVRLADPKDLDAILALDVSISEYFVPLLLEYPEFEGKKEAVVKLLDDEIESDITWFASCIALEKQQRLYVAEENTKIVGFVASHLQDDTIVVIDLVLIDERYRGKGIGRKLMQSCIQTFPQASMCMLVVLANNEAAQAAYKKMGFVLMDEKPLFVQEKYPEPRYICYSLSLSS